ncbi:MAG: hypothetical protein K9L24_03130 [Spirochaetia bacterium]|nr:hypothetical protein [Spirochaetia bacterium]MCF7953964.1 hypothetical protein [Spirochaetales bacterium]
MTEQTQQLQNPKSSRTENTYYSDHSFTFFLLSAVVSVLIQLAAVIIYPRAFPGAFPSAFEASDTSVQEFIIVLAASLLFTPLMLFFHSRGKTLSRESAFWTRAVLVFVIAIPLSGNRWPAFLLVISLMLDTAVTHRTIPSVFICTGLLILDAATQMERRIWGTEVLGSNWDVMTAHTIAYGLFIFIMILVMSWRRQLLRERGENFRLKETVERLSGAGEDFLSYAQSARQRSAEDERNRLTREIHDVAGYTLTNIRMMMEAGLRNTDMDRKELEKLLTWTLKQSQDGQQEIRSILRLIRSRKEDDIRGIQALLQAARVFHMATDTQVLFEWGNLSDRWIAGDRDMLALRILQEGMINAFRHGMAKQIEVSFFEEDRGVSMVVHDDGRGSDSIEMGIGLSGMKERLQNVGGDLRIDSDLPGFRISAFIPVCTEVL